MDTMNTASKTPNEEYFIRKFSSQKPDEPKLTSTILRQEEREFFSKKLTSPLADYFHHVRDFKTICRGELLVR